MQHQTKKKLAELQSLHNQIRLELSQIRTRSPLKSTQYPQRPEICNKKHFQHNYSKTNIVEPRVESANRQALNIKKHFDASLSFHQDFNRDMHKKHYREHYRDAVEIKFSPEKRNLSYLRDKSARRQPLDTNRSVLVGIGEKSKELDRPRSCIRLYPSRSSATAGLL